MELQREGLVSTRCTRDKSRRKKKKKEKPNKILKNVSVTEPGSSLCWCRDRGEKQFGALHLGTEGDSATLKTPVSPDLWGGHGGVPEVPPTLG